MVSSFLCTLFYTVPKMCRLVEVEGVQHAVEKFHSVSTNKKGIVEKFLNSSRGTMA